MADLDAIFKAYDVRGTYPDQFDPTVAAAVGRAFVAFTGADRVLVARDMRESGIALTEAFEAGAVAAGATVVDLGLASTDLLYFAAGALDAPGAMFTASHNPAVYNGIKMCLSGARPIGEETGLAQIKELSRAALGDPPPPAPASGVEHLDLLDRYADHVRSFVDGKKLAPLRVVADTANGMGGLVAPRVFQGLPFALDLLYPELDGNFPNHPADPIQPANLVDLCRRVLDTGADVGLAFDGDADRVFLVDEKGESLSGSLTTALVATAMLERFPGSTVIHNLICSKAVPEVIIEHGGTPVRTRVGHSFIKARMAETGAIFGGEHSGHYYFRDNYRADSGLIAALVVLGMMSEAGEPLSVIRKPLERYAASGEINTEVGDTAAVIQRVEDMFAGRGASVDRLDGLTVDLGDWWFNLRPSNTEPLLRLNLEAPDVASCRGHVEEVIGLFEAEPSTTDS
ncbi:MAG: phosphohexomutase domain-containing protein [Acidimicrobiales bacterium]